MIDFIRTLGRWGLGTFERLGRASVFLSNIIAGIPELFLRFSLVVQQLYSVGVLSVMIILISGLFVGMVLGLQGYNTLVDLVLKIVLE
jgi:phospholipid/cholesterol/gamma-HCH transport system permease protein